MFRVVTEEGLVRKGDKLVEANKAKYISEAYHKAKADGSNPELVAAVEDQIGRASCRERVFRAV